MEMVAPRIEELLEQWQGRTTSKQRVTGTRIHKQLVEEGYEVGITTVKDYLREKRRRLLGDVSENGCTRKRAEHKDHLWSYDFVMDRTDDGRRLKMLAIVDEYTRECLSIEAERTITARAVVKVLAKLFEKRGEPAFIRSDNGPEFVAKVVKHWLEASGVETLYIEAGSPWENAYSETFIGRFGDELLKREVFASLLEAKVLVEEYRNHYNERRPHSSLGYRTPAEFAVSCELE